MSSERVVELLKTAYADEIETVMNYQTNAIVLDGVRAEEIKESLKQDVQEELGHAEQLGQRLKQLDARPPGSAEFTPSRTRYSRPRTRPTYWRLSTACSTPRRARSRRTTI